MEQTMSDAPHTHTALGQLCWQVALPTLRAIVFDLNQRAESYQGSDRMMFEEARTIAEAIWRQRV
jgi:hypothetical protein